MRNRLVVAVLLAVVAVALGSTPVPPTAQPEVIPGMHTLKYDDSTRHTRVCYGSSGVNTGWGNKFTLFADGEWVKIDEVQINLCPPELDHPYHEEIVIYEDDGPGGTPGTVVARKEFDVRVGYWWHFVDFSDDDVWVEGEFYVFGLAKTYPQYLYQWFDQYDNAPLGTQWFYNGSSFSPYTSNGFGDIGIRAIVECHDVSVTQILGSSLLYYGDDYTPSAYVRNLTTWPEPDVPTRFWIEGPSGIVYDETLFVDFPTNLTPFTIEYPTVNINWQAGSYTLRCSTGLEMECVRNNDKQVRGVTVHLKDVGCTEILAPKGKVARGTTFGPQGVVKNFGTVTSSFSVRFRIIDAGNNIIYENTKFVSSLAAGATTTVTFDNWTASTNGTYTGKCVTLLTGDAIPSNDESSNSFEVVSTLSDVGVTEQVSPPSSVNRNTYYYVRAKVKNFGTASATFPVRCSIINPNGAVSKYNRTVTNLAAGRDTIIQFVNRRFRVRGDWKIVTFTRKTVDDNRWNDTLVFPLVSSGSFGWQAARGVPAGAAVNKGAAMASDGAEAVYMVKGYGSPEVFTVGEGEDEGQVVATIPQSEFDLGHGTSMSFSSGSLYLLRGNKSTALLGLNLADGSWFEPGNVPAGASARPPFRGAAMVAANGSLYILKGNKTAEFYRFDPATGSWQELAGMPLGDRARGVKDGGALCVSGSRLFAFKGNGTREFYTYDIASNGWQRLADIPTRKVKVGASLSCLNGTIYATVGGNKTEFYSYNVQTNVWTRLEDVPRDPDGYKVKVGGAMANVEGAVLLLKGKKATVILAYEPEEGADQVGAEPQDGVAAASLSAASLTVAPNPAGSRVRVNFGTPLSGAARVSVYSSAGRMVRTCTATGSWVELNVSDLVNGVYMLNVTAGSTSVSKRLVVQH